MKLIGLVGLVFCVVATAKNPFPSGEYAGNGYWKDTTGANGPYEAYLKIDGNKFHSKIVLATGVTHEEIGSLEFQESGFFSVHHGEKAEPVGHGYCGSVWCHSTSSSGGGVAEETMAFIDGKIYRLGSMKSEEYSQFMWEDALVPAGN